MPIFNDNSQPCRAAKFNFVYYIFEYGLEILTYLSFGKSRPSQKSII